MSVKGKKLRQRTADAFNPVYIAQGRIDAIPVGGELVLDLPRQIHAAPFGTNGARDIAIAGNALSVAFIVPAVL